MVIRKRSAGNSEQLLQILFPDRRNRMRPVPASLRTRGQYHSATPRHTLDLALEDTKLRGIDEIVGRIHRKQRRANALEVRAGVVVTRGIDLVQKVVRVCRSQRGGDGSVERRIATGECWHLLLAQHRI